MPFFPPNPTPFDLFMLFMSYGVGIPALIYSLLLLYRIKKAKRDEEREREEFRREIWREIEQEQAEKEAEQSKSG